MRCSKCGDKIRRLSRNRWGCLNCRWHGPDLRRPPFVIDLLAVGRMLRVAAVIKQIMGGK